MNEILIDQIPNLGDMLRSLEELSLMQVGGTTSNSHLIVQQVIYMILWHKLVVLINFLIYFYKNDLIIPFQLPELRNEITKDKDWKKIAKEHSEKHFPDDEKSRQEDFERMSSLYNFNLLEGLIEGFKCAKCGKDATKRCSKCKSEYYCTRECQVRML